MKKCKRCGAKVDRQTIEYCEECCYDLMGEEVETRPLGGHLCGNLPHGCDQDPLAHEWSGKVAKK